MRFGMSRTATRYGCSIDWTKVQLNCEPIDLEIRGNQAPVRSNYLLRGVDARSRSRLGSGQE